MVESQTYVLGAIEQVENQVTHFCSYKTFIIVSKVLGKLSLEVMTCFKKVVGDVKAWITKTIRGGV